MALLFELILLIVGLLLGPLDVDLQVCFHEDFLLVEGEKTEAEGHRGNGREEAWRVLQGFVPIYQPSPQYFYQNYIKKRAARIGYF